jgi:putative hydroxymethylpyrimidine transport system substrate-binding protein
MKRISVAVAIALVAIATAAGCGEKHETVAPSAHANAQALTLMLDWFPNADHVGIYQALAEGDFDHAGLKVHVQVPSDPSLPL